MDRLVAACDAEAVLHRATGLLALVALAVGIQIGMGPRSPRPTFRASSTMSCATFSCRRPAVVMTTMSEPETFTRPVRVTPPRLRFFQACDS